MGKDIHIFLAGGKSTRFPSNKTLYTFADGQTMIEKVMSPYKDEECYILAHKNIIKDINLLDIKQCKLIVSVDTKSSGETAYVGLMELCSCIKADDHVMFHDCDVLTNKIARATSVVKYGLPTYGKYDNCYFAGTYYFGTYKDTVEYLKNKMSLNLPEAFKMYTGSKQWIMECDRFFPFNTPVEFEISSRLLELYDDESSTICVDIDGTIIDNNNLIIKSWEEAGISDYTPGQHVDCSKNVKAIKQENYKKCITNKKLTLNEIVFQLLLVNNYEHIVLATGMSVDSLYITAPLFLDQFMSNKNTTIVLLDKNKAILEIPNCAYFIGDSETDGKCAKYMKKKWLKWQW